MCGVGDDDCEGVLIYEYSGTCAIIIWLKPGTGDDVNSVFYFFLLLLVVFGSILADVHDFPTRFKIFPILLS